MCTAETNNLARLATWLIAFGLTLLCAAAGTAHGDSASITIEKSLLIIAPNEISDEIAELTDFLDGKDVSYLQVAPEAAASYHSHPHIVVVGGLNADVMTPYAGLLNQDELNWIREAGNTAIYEKTNH